MSTETTNYPNNILPQAGTSAEIPHAYLLAMEAREITLAKSFLADDFTMTFPGDCTFSTLEQQMDWGKERYLSVKKNFENFDEMTEGSQTVVYCFGTLYGERLDGTEFSDIRFIDRFSIRDGKLTSQLVWNDMGAQ